MLHCILCGTMKEKGTATHLVQKLLSLTTENSSGITTLSKFVRHQIKAASAVHAHASSTSQGEEHIPSRS
jgi:hypothetical protein